MSDVIVAPSIRDLDALSRDLAAWLGAKLPDARDLRLTDVTYPRGAGQSHETILFDAHWRQAGEARSHGYVVRIKPTGYTMFPDNLFDEQYALMRALHAHGAVRVAEPYWIEHDPAVLGAPFFLMEKMTGRVPVTVPRYAESGWVADATPAQRRRMWTGAVRQLAAIQSLPTDALPFLAGPAHARDGLAQELDKYARFVALNLRDGDWPVLAAGLERLERTLPANQPAGLVWGDARMGNMMFDGDFDVVAVMDWEQPSLGGALHDLAWFLQMSAMHHDATADRPFLAGMGTREETIDLWERETGLSAADIGWYEDFTRLKLSCLSVRMAHLKGSTPPDAAWLARRLKVEPAL
ncbi:MAG: phosphotransferase family protein [Sphingomonas sp.]